MPSKRSPRAIQTFLPFVPPTVTHNDLEAYTFKRNGKTLAGIRKSERLKGAEDLMRPYVKSFADNSHCLPLRPPVREVVKVCWPTRGRHEQGEPRVDAPDLDNWVKVFNDLCEDVHIVRNDAHVADLHVMKMWADPAGVFVRFEEIAI